MLRAKFGLSVVAASASSRVGTQRYMAPEDLCRKHYSTEVDVYSFGLVVCFVCTGAHPEKVPVIAPRPRE